MTKNKKIILFSMIAVAVIAALSICLYFVFNRETTSNSKDKAAFAEKSNLAQKVLEQTVNTNTQNTISLGDATNIAGSGAAFNNGVLTISNGGTYQISGTLSDGYIDITAKDEVTLVFDNVSITNPDGCCVYSDDAKTLTLYTKKGTENTFTDGSDYLSTDAKGTIFSNDDLVLDGEGKLIVNANYKHAIACDDEIVVNGGEYLINAAYDGVHANEIITLISPSITISSQGDGIQSDLSSVSILGGNIDITTAGGSENAPVKQNNDFGGRWQTDYDTKYTETEKNSGSPQSFKGIKAEVAVDISGGSLTLDTYDDAVHSDNSVTISGGSLNINAGDDAVHGDVYLTVSGGDISANTCYEGLEAGTIEIKDGNINIKATDDGVNAVENESSTEDDMTNRAPFGGGSAMEGYGSLIISGGNVVIDSEGDGLDSNATIDISGGYTVVYGPETSGNGPLDYGTSCTVTNGTLIAGGSSGMAQATDDNGQNALMLYFDSTLSSSDSVTVNDSDGKEILKYHSEKSYNCILFSSPELKENDTVTILVNGSEKGDVKIVSGVYYANVSESGITEAQGGFEQPGMGMGHGEMNRGMGKGEIDRGQGDFVRPF